MTIDEKLQHFYEVSVEEAKEEAAMAIQEHRESLAQMLEDHKAARRQSAEAVRREINKALSAEQITLKRGWSRKQEELKEALFAEVKQKAQAFMETPEYMDYLCKQIREVKSFAGEDEIQISLSSGDSSKLETLSQKTGAELTVSSDDFIGGIRAAIPQKNIMIDNSFLEGLESMRREFKFDGGLKNE